MSNKLLLLTFIVLHSACCEREHKVHNIVLYPEKHSWCQITPIQQIVGSPGYESVTIDNNVCVGACYSYSIPKTQPAEPGELIGPYCDSCQPSEIKCYHVNLHRDEKNLELPKILQKRVQIITNCSCQSCDKIRKDDCEISDENTLELPKNLFTDEKNGNKANGDELPELLETNSNKSTPEEETENDIKFKNKLKKWFEIYQNESDPVKNDDEYYLQKFNTLLYHTPAADHNQDINAKIEKDLENLPESFGVEGAPSHHKGAHIGMGITHTQNDIVQDDLVKKHHEDTANKVHVAKSGHHHHDGHHNHHLGEEQHIGMNVVHLIKGPHGSMVAAPVEAKLQIDSDALQPNSEGIVIDYQNDHAKNAGELIEN